jgi:hypothetical protein
MMLSGYKTYITAGVAVIGAWAAVLTGDVAMIDAVKITIDALLAAFIRNGVAASK